MEKRFRNSRLARLPKRLRRNVRDGYEMRRLIAITVLVVACLFSTGCALLCCGFHQQKSLGIIDASIVGAKLTVPEKCPEHVCGIILAFSEEMGGLKPDSPRHPDWPLVIRLQIAELKTQRVVLDKELTRNQMIFANWHSPRTAVMLDIDQPRPYKLLKEGVVYQFTVQVVTPMTNKGNAEFYLHWID